MAARPPTKARARTAWEVGRTGDPPPEWISGNADLLAAYDQGLAAHDEATSAPQAKKKPATSTPPAAAPDTTPTPAATTDPQPPRSAGPSWLTKPIHGGDGTGLLFGLLAYTVALNYIRGGPEGVRKWAAAKFLNRTASSSKQPAAPFYDGTPGHQLPAIPGLTPGPSTPAPKPGRLPTIPGLTP